MTGSMKDPIKRVLGQTIYASRLNGLLLKNTAVVVAFHRVKNSARPEGLTIDVPMFERYCRFFRDHFHVVPLRDIVTRLEQGRRLNRELAITFDDGYLDNFDNAAPVLERMSLPATFFVVTRWIGTNIVPWWDAAAGSRHPWMGWTHVRSLHQRGFDIGAHTRTHVNLGKVDAAGAREEIAGARHDLERQLGSTTDLFAYPYGHRSNLADAARAAVRDAGFRCCCSCFGGLVRPETDPFHLARVPISPRYPSPYGFGFEVASDRSLISVDPWRTACCLVG